MYFIRTALILLWISGSLVQCKGNTDGKASGAISDSTINKELADTLIQGISNPLSGIVFDSASIPRFLARYPEFKEFSADISVFYRNRYYNYAWFEKDGLTEPAQILLEQLYRESIDGIAVNAPYKDSLQQMFHFGDFTERPEHQKPDVNGELMLTGQYLRLAKKIWAGQY
jgi:hypothetical protein